MANMIFHEFDWDDTNDILKDIDNGNIQINHNDYIFWPSPKIKIDQYKDAEEISLSILNSCILVINGDGFHVYRNINGKNRPKLTLPKKKMWKKK